MTGSAALQSPLRNMLPRDWRAFVNMMPRQAQVIMHRPEPATRSGQAGLNTRPDFLGGAALEPRAATTNRTENMGVAIAKLSPAIHPPVDAHRHPVRVDAAKTGVPRLNTIQPDIFAAKDAIQHRTLAAMTKDAIHGMRHNRQPTLLVNKLNAAFHTQARRNMFLDEEREHMSFPRTHLFTDDKVKAIIALRPQITRPQRTINHIMVGERNHIQIGMMLDVMQNLLNSCRAIAIGAMHMQ